MFDNKSDYALNKREKDAIIYISVTGSVQLTRSEFTSEEEFQKWKDWSDSDYMAGEKAGRGFYDNSIPLDEKLDVIGAVLSAESEFFSKQAEMERLRLCTELMEHVKSSMTEKQYRRLWMFYAESISVKAIAVREGVSHQNISESISSARKNIYIFLKKHPAKMPVFL